MGSRESLAAAAFAAAAVLAACAPAKRAEPPVQPNPAAPVAAAPAPVPAPPAAMPSGTLTKVGGTVVAEDPSAHSLTIKDYHGKTRTFRVAGAAKITKGGAEKAIALSGVSAGDRVHLQVGGDVAASIHVMVVAAK